MEAKKGQPMIFFHTCCNFFQALSKFFKLSKLLLNCQDFFQTVASFQDVLCFQKLAFQKTVAYPKAVAFTKTVAFPKTVLMRAEHVLKTVALPKTVEFHMLSQPFVTKRRELFSQRVLNEGVKYQYNRDDLFRRFLEI